MDNLVTNDASIQNLVQAMLDSVNIHISTEELVKNKFQKQLLQRLCQQITECALFIQAYSKTKSSGDLICIICLNLELTKVNYFIQEKEE